MRVRIGCEFAYQSTGPTSMLFMVRPREDPRQRRLDEARRVTSDVPIHDYDDAFGKFFSQESPVASNPFSNRAKFER